MNEWFKNRDKDCIDADIKHSALLRDDKVVEKGNKDEVFKYHIAKVNEDDYSIKEEPTITNEDFVLGIRPERIKVGEGKREAEIYGAMPTGMESTIKICVGEYLLTSVVFGDSMFALGQKTKFDISGNEIFLFDRKTGKYISSGSIEIM